METMDGTKVKGSKIRFIPLSYEQSDSQPSALRLVFSLRPDWEHTDGKIEFVRFTDGITNALLKVVNTKPGVSKEEIDNEAILLRAYGHNTDILIDREREAQNHELLMGFGLAPQLLARFRNGMLYRYIQGTVTSPADLRRQEIWRAVARRIAQWHALVPCLPRTREPLSKEVHGSATLGGSAPTPSKMDPALQSAIDEVAPGKLAPNIWTVMQKWIYALPITSEAEKARQASLQIELLRLVGEFSQRPGLGENSLVFAHCDLLSGNVIVQPRLTSPSKRETVTNGHPISNGTHKPEEIVSFIDFEYAVPSPAAFDIANHFAEWGGFDCSHEVLPTRSQRRDFIREYICSYFSYFPSKSCNEEEEIEKLFKEVDLFRGVPGFYWGIWALIQAEISQIKFDYRKYAELRLGEYWAWRGEQDGSRERRGEEMSVREKRLAEE